MDELISKRAVIEDIEKARANVGHNLERSIGKSIIEILDDVGRDIDRLPSVEPKRGKWKNIVDGIEYTWGTCDLCGARIPMPYMYYKYCPNCGADMRGEKDE